MWTSERQAIKLNQANAKRALYVGCAGVGRATRLGRWLGTDGPDVLRVLMYHKVTDARPNSIAVSLASFEAQQRFLHEHYAVVSLAAVRRWLAAGEPLPARPVLLTFDDGYRDNLENAHPILARYAHPAVLFVPTDFVGRRQPLPHDRHLPTENPTLDWDELRRMRDVFEIGSHGCTHRVLTRMAPDEARREIVESKRELESRLEAPVTAFSYPKGSIGDFDAQLEGEVARAGYDVAFTTLPGVVRRDGARPLRMGRHNVEDYGPAYFGSLLDGSAGLLALKDTRLGYRLKRELSRRSPSAGA